MYFIKLTAVAEPKGMFSGRDTGRTFTYTEVCSESEFETERTKFEENVLKDVAENYPDFHVEIHEREYRNLDAEPFKFAFENLNPAQFAEYLRHYEIRM